jgi:hypothetical protein
MVFVVVWSVLVVAALIATLQSLHRNDFDGLNNIFQIPFALPWFLLPIPAFTHSHVTDAWVTAGMGLVNGVVITAWLTRRHRRP